MRAGKPETMHGAVGNYFAGSLKPIHPKMDTGGVCKDYQKRKTPTRFPRKHCKKTGGFRPKLKTATTSY